MPLSRSSTSSIGISEHQVPGSYEDDEDDGQDDFSAHIRYGKIPQRVPRRYKTVKKLK